MWRFSILRIYWDGSDIPSVECPLGDFFGVGLGLERPVESLMVRDSSSGRSRNSYWQMPFEKRIRITVTRGRRRVSNLYFHVDWKKVAALPPGPRISTRAQAGAVSLAALRILSVRGRRHYVGTVFSVVRTRPAGSARATNASTPMASKPDMRARAPGTTSTTRGASASRRASTRRRSPMAQASAPACPRTLARRRSVRFASLARHRASWLDAHPDGSCVRVRGAPRSVQQRRVLVGRDCGDQPEVPYGSGACPSAPRQIEVEDRAADGG